jgi:phosphonate transport system substrate-binding protein
MSSPSAFSVKNVLALLLPAAIVVGAGAYFYANVDKPGDADYLALMGDYQKRFGPAAKLDAKFTDADGDLVADAPTDKAKFVNPDTLVFCGIPQDGPERGKEIWAGFLDALAKATGKKVEYAADVSSPEEELAGLRDGKIHVAVCNTGLVPSAVNTAGYVPLAVPAHADGSFAYKMRLIVPAKSDIEKPEQLRGRQLTLSNAASNAGFKAPIYLMANKFNLALNKDYQFNVSGSYVKSVEGVEAGKYQAAAVAGDFLDRLVAQGKANKDKFKVIYESEEFPPLCIGTVYNLDPELAGKVKKALADFDFTGTSLEKEYGSVGLTKFAPVSYKTNWAFVRDIDAGLLKLADRK